MNKEEEDYLEQLLKAATKKRTEPAEEPEAVTEDAGTAATEEAEASTEEAVSADVPAEMTEEFSASEDIVPERVEEAAPVTIDIPELPEEDNSAADNQPDPSDGNDEMPDFKSLLKLSEESDADDNEEFDETPDIEKLLKAAGAWEEETEEPAGSWESEKAADSVSLSEDLTEPAGMPEEMADLESMSLPEDLSESEPAGMPEEMADPGSMSLSEDLAESEPAGMPEEMADLGSMSLPEDLTEPESAGMPEEFPDLESMNLPEETAPSDVITMPGEMDYSEPVNPAEEALNDFTGSEAAEKTALEDEDLSSILKGIGDWNSEAIPESETYSDKSGETANKDEESFDDIAGGWPDDKGSYTDDGWSDNVLKSNDARSAEVKDKVVFPEFPPEETVKPATEEVKDLSKMKIGPEMLAEMVGQLPDMSDILDVPPLEEEKLATNDDPNHVMTPEEIAALVGGMDAPAEAEKPAVNDDPNHVMTPEEIAALVGGMDAPAEAEKPAVNDDPNHVMTPEEIAALVGGMDAPAEAEKPAVNDDPNHVMTPEEIAALVGGMDAPAEAEKPAVNDDPNHVMTPEEIAALVGGMDAPAEEEKPGVNDDPNHMMTPEEIAALVGGMDAPAAEEKPGVNDDPNHMMTPEEIAALVGGMDAPAEGEKPAENDDPNHIMTPEEIAALVGGMDAPAEEEKPAENDDPNHIMTPEEIAALVGGMDAPAEEPAQEDDPNHIMSSEEIDALLGNSFGDPEEEKGADASTEDLFGDGGVLAGDEVAADELLSKLAMGDEEPAADSSSVEDMSLDDIEAQMKAAEQAGSEDTDGVGGDENLDDEDVSKLLASLGNDDVDLGDIGELLEKAQNGELVDESITAEPEGAPAAAAGGEEAEDGKKKEKKGLFASLFAKKEKKEKEKKVEEVNGEPVAKKPGFFARLMAILLADDEDELVEVPEDSQTKLSAENHAVLAEIEKEKAAGKKKEKKKKEKKEKPEKEKKQKKEKPKKPKKEKQAPEEEPGKLPRRYVKRIWLLAFSILAALLVITLCVPALTNMGDARQAYIDNDYKEAFLTLYGKDLNESDRLIYEKSRTIVLVDRKIESYENYRMMNMNREALDALLQGLKRYYEVRDDAERLGVNEQVEDLHRQIVTILNSEYGLSEQEGIDILGYSALDYTGKLDAVVSGQPYRMMQDLINEKYGLPQAGSLIEDMVGGEPEEVEPELPDLLPGEQEYLNKQ